MHYAVLALAIAATSNAHAINLEKRKVFTVTKYVDVWTTVTVYNAGASPAPVVENSRKGFDFSNFRKKKSSALVVATASIAPSSIAVSSAIPSQAPSQVAAPSVVSSQAPVSSAVPQVASSAAPQAASSAAPLPQQPASSAVKVVTPSPSTVPASTAPPAGDDYQSLVLYHHNVHRANHSAPDVAWSQPLADTALKIAKTCQYGHSMDVDGGGYGQNIAAGLPVSKISAVITEQFYNGEVNSFTGYGQATPSDFDANFKKYGHFTAVVWVGTKSVGCASYDCSKTGLGGVAGNVPPIFHVCNYGPPGNYMGEFGKNVLPSLNQPTVHA